MRRSLHIPKKITFKQSRLTTTFALKRDQILQGVEKDYIDDIARVVELTEKARDEWTLTKTVFFPPPVISQALSVVERLADCAAAPIGGHPNAERCRLILGREEMLATALADPSTLHASTVAAVNVTGNFLFDPASHRDFLGACLGTGIERTVVGDILVQGDVGCHIIVKPSMVEHLETNLTQVRTVPVKTRRLDSLSELRVPASSVKEISSIEPSLRLDAIASAGFRMSRSKCADLVKGGDVRVNWKGVTKPSFDVKEGDVISCSGKGRIEIKSVNETKKGKWMIGMVRYI